MAPSAAAPKMDESEKGSEEPVISEKIRKGIRGVLVGPPGSGKGTQVITSIMVMTTTVQNLLFRKIPSPLY